MLAHIDVNEKSMRFSSVVVITLASHARGPGFDPQLNQNRFKLYVKRNLTRESFNHGKPFLVHKSVIKRARFAQNDSFH